MSAKTPPHSSSPRTRLPTSSAAEHGMPTTRSSNSTAAEPFRSRTSTPRTTGRLSVPVAIAPRMEGPETSSSTVWLRRMAGHCAASTATMEVSSVQAPGNVGSARLLTCDFSSHVDTCRISNSCQDKGKSCDRYKGVVKGSGSSKKLGSGPDNVSCFVSSFSESC